MRVEVLITPDGTNRPTRKVVVDGRTTISIGRSPQSDIFLDSDLVSRTHALVHVGAEGLRVEDRSANGTFVGGSLVHGREASGPFGAPIAIGGYTVQIFPAASRAPASGQGNDAEPTAPREGMEGKPPQDRAAEAMLRVPDRAPHAKGSGPYRATEVEPRGPGHAPEARSLDVPPGRKSVAQEDPVALRRRIHKDLPEQLDLAKLDGAKLDDPSMRSRVLAALRRLVEKLDPHVLPVAERDALIGELADEVLGLGPLERFIQDPTVSEIMVVDPTTIYVERRGKLVRTEARFTDDDRVRACIERIVTPIGRRIDESSPLVDARLKDGSRVNVIIPPIALRGSCITIRKFARTPLTLGDLVDFGTLTMEMGRFITRSVICKKNIVISGGTGSGKTTLLNVLSASIPPGERIVTIEDAAELQLKQPHVVSLETRPPNMEGRGEHTIRDLVRNALRMRPDRIVVGECRGGEALDMLQAMNTGHDGSLTTTHANSPAEALARIETLVLTGGVDLPSRAIREQIASSIHLVIQQTRYPDGSRRIAEIAEVTGIEDTGEVALRPLFRFVRTGTAADGKVLGEHRATGYLPSFLDEFLVAGLVKKGEAYL